jgi:RNA helicase HrpA
MTAAPSSGTPSSSSSGLTRASSWARLNPLIQFPEQLPVSKRSSDITEAIREHSVLIIAGETGSGKTTQVPKCALLAGLGQKGKILMTQPRRLAAVRTALRIAEELGVEPGQEVGYRVRFQHKAHHQGLLEVVTDGIPLSGDLSHHPFKGCEAVIVDEVHERSVNIDLLLGLLKKELERNPKFKVILMSATLDTERYQSFFPTAKALQVEGRTFPVDTLYRTPERNANIIDTLCQATEEAILETRGDILCFLATERDIRESEKRLSERLGNDVEVLPLFSRLSQKEQDKVFRPPGKKRRVILSTNIAETSLTLPGVRCVIDSGQARVLRFQAGRGVPQLEVEAISKASAQQRAGRAGRTAPGMCLRLYPERDFLAMEDFTVPEIQRQDLATVILKLISMGVREPETFPFPDPPSSKSMKSGERQLEFLGAVIRKDDGLHLSKIGKEMVRQPLAPRLSHLMLNAKKEGLLLPVSIISAFLSMQDPRQNPIDQLSKARDAHRRFRVKDSDFLGILELFRSYQEQAENHSGTALKRWCNENFLAWRRMKEWEQLTQDLGKTVDRDFKLKTLTTVADEVIHQLILGSHLDCILEPDHKADDGSFHSLGRRAIFPHPSSALSKNDKTWCVCVSFLNTSRLFALHLCTIQPEWISELAPHLIRIERGDPHYDIKTQKVVSEEVHRFRSHVVKTIANKDHFPFDPEEATRVFIREALIRQPIESLDLPPILKIYDDLKNCDAAFRTREQCYNEDRLVESWRKRIGLCSRYSDLKKLEPSVLNLSLNHVLEPEEQQAIEHDTPLQCKVIEENVSIRYTYAPGSEQDGADLQLSPQQLAILDAHTLEHAIPAWHLERSRLAWESLPKAFRKQFSLEHCCRDWEGMWKGSPDQHSLTIWRRWMLKHTSLEEVIEQWLDQTQQKIPVHFWPKFVLIDHKGQASQRYQNVQEAQVHSLSAMEERHYLQLKKQGRQKIGTVEGDALALITSALEAWSQWPKMGKEAQDLRGKPLPLFPQFKVHRGHLWLEPQRDESLARQYSLSTLARLHGPLSAQVPAPDAQVLDQLSKSNLDLKDLLPKVQSAAWENLWLRMRDSDLENIDTLRSRLKKCEERYWSKDLQHLLAYCSRCGHLSTRARWVHPKTSQEHWIVKRCGMASMHGRPDPDKLSRLNLDHAQEEIDLCLIFLEEQHRHPESFDRICQGWRALEKKWKFVSKNTLYAHLYTAHGVWHKDLFGENWNDASFERLQLGQSECAARERALEKLQRRWQDAENWMVFAKDDLEAECQAKSRNRKKILLTELEEMFSDPESIHSQVEKFCKQIEQTQKTWSQLRTQKKVILEEEKTLKSDKLKDALLTAWIKPKTKMEIKTALPKHKPRRLL